jgi:hypothetical protein
MDTFESALKRAFAEAPEPVDAGFSERVSVAVARTERQASLVGIAQQVGLAAAGAALAYAVATLAMGLGPQLMATFGLELARAHGALTTSTSGFDFSMFGAGLTQIFLVLGALAGGAVAYRTVRE